MIIESVAYQVLCVEPDYLLYSKVSSGCIPQEDWTPLHAGGTCPPRGVLGASGPLTGVKIDVKFPCKSLLISSQFGPFIRQMI